MTERPGDIPEQVRKFAPKGKPREADNPTDQAGHALLALLRQAAQSSNDECDQAMTQAHKLSIELRAAEDRVRQIAAEADYFRDRAMRAEGWLTTIAKEVEEKLVAPMAAARSGG